MGYDLDSARKAGISDSEIIDTLAQVHGYDLAGARAAGIADAEILNALASRQKPAEPVIERESPELFGYGGAGLGAVGAVGDVIYSKGRPLIRAGEKLMGMEPGGPPKVKPRTFQDPSTVAQGAIERRTPVDLPEGTTTTVRNWTAGKPGAGTGQQAGEFLGGANYSEADKFAKERLAFETANPTMKVQPGSRLAIPEQDAEVIAKQRAALQAQANATNQAEVNAVAQTRADRLQERNTLKDQANRKNMLTGSANVVGKVALPIMGGYEAGAQGTQAYNRLTRPDLTTGDVAAGATNLLGSAAGMRSMFPGKARIPAAIISQGAGAIANFLDKRNPRNEPEEQTAPGMANGGSVTSPKLKSLSDFLDQLMQQATAPTPAPAPAAPQGGMPPGMPGMPPQGDMPPGMPPGMPGAPPQQPPMQQPPTQQSPLNAMMPQNFSGGGLALAKKGLEFAKKSNKVTPGLDLGNTLPSATFRAAPEQTVTDPLRNAFPGIYKRPDVIAKEAAERVAPESESLKQLFGVTRDDLYEMGKGRVGNIPGVLPGAAANPKGSRAGLNVMNPRNEQRILDVLSESEKYPQLVRGMDPWYIMDPAYQRLEQLVGPEEAVRKYRQLNTLTGMASPGSDVLTEMNRGTAANFLATQGRFNDFLKYGGKGFNPDAPADIQNILGHPYHMTAQGKPMQQYLDTGDIQMSSPKVPMYIDASGVRQTGFQTDMPVGDAHWSRAVGLADTRGKATRKGKEVIPGASVTNPEMSQLGPWWRDKIASQVGLESVPAQARAWGAFSPQTGVESPIGAPKLELLSMKIMEAAKRYGVSPEQARDMVLMGEGYAGKKEGGLV